MDDIHEACRLGKLVMSVLRQREQYADQEPKLAYLYHGIVGIYSEPLQYSVNCLRRGKMLCKKPYQRIMISCC